MLKKNTNNAKDRVGICGEKKNNPSVPNPTRIALMRSKPGKVYSLSRHLQHSFSQTKILPDAIGIDIDENDDPLWTASYVKDIYNYYRSVQHTIPNYMHNQTEVTNRSRAILVDWLLETHAEQKFDYETLYLTIHIIDRFLGKKNVVLDDFQRIACGALLIASKYEEVFHFSVRDILAMCAMAYDEQQVSIYSLLRISGAGYYIIKLI